MTIIANYLERWRCSFKKSPHKAQLPLQVQDREARRKASWGEENHSEIFTVNGFWRRGREGGYNNGIEGMLLSSRLQRVTLHLPCSCSVESRMNDKGKDKAKVCYCYHFDCVLNYIAPMFIVRVIHHSCRVGNGVLDIYIASWFHWKTQNSHPKKGHKVLLLISVKS